MSERKMTKKRAKKNEETEIEATEPADVGARRDRIVEEVAGVITLLISVLLITSLISFQPGGANLVGPIGHFFADSVLFLFGLASFAFVLVTLAWGVALLNGRRLFTRHREVLGYLLVLATAPTLLHMGVPEAVLGHPPGGIMGGLLGGVLVAGLGPVGGLLCSSTALLIAAMLVTDRSIGELAVGGMRRTSSWIAELRRTSTAPVIEVAEVAAEPEAPTVEEDPEVDPETTTQPIFVRLRSSVRAALRRGRTRAARREPDPEAGTSENAAEVTDAVEEAIPIRSERRAVVRETSGAVSALTDDSPSLGDDPPWVLDLSGAAESTDESSVPRPPIARSGARRLPAREAVGQPDPESVDADAIVSSEPVKPPPAPKAAPVVEDREEPIIVHPRKGRDKRSAADLERAQQVHLPLTDAQGKQWDFPPLSFLRYEDQTRSDIDQEKLRQLAARLEKVLADFKVKGRVSGICPGPVVTLFEFQPESGTKLSRISGLSDDIAMALRAHKVRIIAPIPGKGCVGIEVPNDYRETVFLKEILADKSFVDAKSKLTLALGKDIEGLPIVMDLAKSPHLLIAGTTGSGKSVSVNAMITSLLYNTTPDEVKMILIDPKQLEFAIYENVPHLLLPVVTDPAKAATALNWAVQEMERRYKLMSELKVRNLKGYNEKLAKLVTGVRDVDTESEDYVPSPTEAMLAQTDIDGRPSHREMFHLVVVVDEFADLMMVAGKEVEVAVARLAQKARAAGIHVILATQRPSVDVITGLIKANFPTRISFRLMSGTDSRTVLDTIGAENLLGMGDMLYRPPGTSSLQRVHGAFVDEAEIEQVVDFVAAQRKPEFDESILAAPEVDAEDSDEPVDELYDQAVSVVIEAGFASISMVQRKLRIGYNRSARIVEEMERQGLVGPTSGGSSRREVLVGGAHLSVAG